MVPSIVIGLLVVGIASFVVMRRWAGRCDESLVSPILLDEALDADLRRLCRELRRRNDLSTAERCRLCRLIVNVAERRAVGEDTEADRGQIVEAQRALKRGAANRGAEGSNSA